MLYNEKKEHNCANSHAPRIDSRSNPDSLYSIRK